MHATTDRRRQHRRAERHRVASLAHGTAHEITALREVMARLPTCSDPMVLLSSMVVERTERIAQMADQVVRHG